MSEEEHTLRAAPGRRAVEEGALVLAAAGIAHRVAGNAGSWRLLVAARDADRSIAALDAYDAERRNAAAGEDRKSTRLNSSHLVISYAVFCLKKKKKKK